MCDLSGYDLNMSKPNTCHSRYNFSWSGNSKIMANVKVRRWCLQFRIDSSTSNRWTICFSKRRSISPGWIGTRFFQKIKYFNHCTCVRKKLWSWSLLCVSGITGEWGRKEENGESDSTSYLSEWIFDTSDSSYEQMCFSWIVKPAIVWRYLVEFAVCFSIAGWRWWSVLVYIACTKKLKNVYMLHRFVYCVYGKSHIIYETIKKRK